MKIEKIVSPTGDIYFLATLNFNGRMILAEGKTFLDALTGALGICEAR